jgi:hypothetical protein
VTLASCCICQRSTSVRGKNKKDFYADTTKRDRHDSCRYSPKCRQCCEQHKQLPTIRTRWHLAQSLMKVGVRNSLHAFGQISPFSKGAFTHTITFPCHVVLSLIHTYHGMVCVNRPYSYVWIKHGRTV